MLRTSCDGGKLIGVSQLRVSNGAGVRLVAATCRRRENFSLPFSWRKSSGPEIQRQPGFLTPIRSRKNCVSSERARLAELEVDYAREKSRVDTMEAALFRRLREHYQKRDRLRLIVDYRRKYLDSLVGRASSRAVLLSLHCGSSVALLHPSIHQPIPIIALMWFVAEVFDEAAHVGDAHAEAGAGLAHHVFLQHDAAQIVRAGNPSYFGASALSKGLGWNTWTGGKSASSN